MDGSVYGERGRFSEVLTRVLVSTQFTVPGLEAGIPDQVRIRTLVSPD